MSIIILPAHQAEPGDRVNVGNGWVVVEEVAQRDSEWIANGAVQFRATDSHTYRVDRYHDVERVESEEDYALACDAMHAANPHRFEGEL